MTRPAAPARRLDSVAVKAAVFGAYVLLSTLLGERFPFSRFTMFSSARASESVLDAREDGRKVDVRDYADFRGSFAALPPEPVDSWEERELRGFIARGAASTAPAGARTLEIRVCRSSVDAAGAALDCRSLWKGEARRR